MAVPEPRVSVIEGRPTLVVERRPPLPATVGELVAALSITFRAPIRIEGWRGECGRQDHRLVNVLSGRYTGPDRVTRDLQLHQCRDCEAICVRDVSLDFIDNIHPGTAFAKPSRLAPRRRNLVLAWYSGARRNQRIYT